MAGMCNGTHVWMPWIISNVTLTKMDSELFWTNFFKLGVKWHQGDTVRDQRGEKTKIWFPLPSVCIYFSSRRPTWSPIHDTGPISFFPASRRGGTLDRVARRSTSTAYHRTAKAQLTPFRIHFLRNNWKELFSVLTHITYNHQKKKYTKKLSYDLKKKET